ncbi:CPBP family intramembrane glutamic endopeptidase [Psychroserpens sp. MEBiC05023]
MTATNLYTITALIVGIIFPVYAIWNGKKAKTLLIENPNVKILVFRQTGIILLVLTLIVALPFIINDRSIVVIGLDFLKKPLSIIGLFLIAFAALYILKSVKLNKKSAEKFTYANKHIYFLMPTTLQELNITVIVSFIAGICEELIYRGFLYWYLSQYISIIPAMILANLPFALGHLTSTGKKNTFGAFVLAFIFSGAYFLTNSLWLPMLLHIIVDLYSMIIAYKASQILGTNHLQ